MKFLGVIFAIGSFLKFATAVKSRESSYAYMHLENADGKKSETVCVNFDPHFTIESSLENAHSWDLYVPNSPDPICNASKDTLAFFRNEDWKNRLIIAGVRNMNKCPFDMQAKIAQTNSAAGVLFVIPPQGEKLWSQYSPPSIKYESTKIPLFFAKRMVYDNVLMSMSAKSGEKFKAKIYQPDEPEVDASLFVIFLIAVICYAIGGFWSGHYRNQIYAETLERHRIWNQLCNVPNSDFSQNPNSNEQNYRSITSRDQQQNNAEAQEAQNRLDQDRLNQDLFDQDRPNQDRLNQDLHAKHSAQNHEPVATPFNVCTLVCFVTVLVAVLLLLFYFYNVFVWIVIILFTISSINALYAAAILLADLIPGIHWHLPFSFAKICKKIFKRRLAIFQSNDPLDISHIFAFGICSAISICWCLMRHWSFAFILQDILGMFFCINLVKILRLPNLKWLTALLSLVLIYDVIFVFVSPLWTSSGCSIMVDVATGGGCSAAERSNRTGPPDQSHEYLPVVFKVPHLNNPMLSCYDLSVDVEWPSSLLGFGDVILPGLLVAYCFAFDLAWKTKWKVYYVICCVSYAFGMVATFSGLYLLQTAQPALIYLVPFTLIPVHIAALIRKEWRQIWNGDWPAESQSIINGDARSDIESVPGSSTSEQSRDLLKARH